jgi:hypothetical protein
MKHVRSADVIELDLVGGTVVLLVCNTMKATDPGLTLLCGAVFLLLVASRRKTKTIKAQIIEIVDEQAVHVLALAMQHPALASRLQRSWG